MPDHMSSPDALIEILAHDLRPGRRLAPPFLRALGWCAAVCASAAALACFADIGAMVRRLTAAPDIWLAVTESTLTAVLAAIAAFQTSLPDRKPSWALLPLPRLLLRRCERPRVPPRLVRAGDTRGRYCGGSGLPRLHLRRVGAAVGPAGGDAAAGLSGAAEPQCRHRRSRGGRGGRHVAQFFPSLRRGRHRSGRPGQPGACRARFWRG